MKPVMFAMIPLLLCLSLVMVYGGEESILFSDDFSTPDPGWGESSEQMRIEGKAMLIQPKVKMSFTNLYQGTLFGDADVRVKVAQTIGQPDRPGGLAFWGSDYNSFYVAEVSTDGGFGVARLTQGKWLYPIAWKTLPGVKKGLNEINELRVVTKGNMATVYVNDEQVANFKGYPPEGGGMVGVCAESGSEPYTWKYTDFSVRKPE